MENIVIAATKYRKTSRTLSMSTPFNQELGNRTSARPAAMSPLHQKDRGQAAFIGSQYKALQAMARSSFEIWTPNKSSVTASIGDPLASPGNIEAHPHQRLTCPIH